MILNLKVIIIKINELIGSMGSFEALREIKINICELTWKLKLFSSPA